MNIFQGMVISHISGHDNFQCWVTPERFGSSMDSVWQQSRNKWLYEQILKTSFTPVPFGGPYLTHSYIPDPNPFYQGVLYHEGSLGSSGRCVLCTCTCVCAYAHVFVHMHMYLCICACIFAYAHVFVHMHMYLCICTCICASLSGLCSIILFSRKEEM